MSDLHNVIGERGEQFALLALTEHAELGGSLFRPVFLGGKFPAIDCYVELATIPGWTPFFFGQVKSGTTGLSAGSMRLDVRLTKSAAARLLELPAPTYVLGVHEPTGRVFVRSVHAKPARGFTTIPLTHELNRDTLCVLRDEVADFWRRLGAETKPAASRFA